MNIQRSGIGKFFAALTTMGNPLILIKGFGILIPTSKNLLPIPAKGMILTFLIEGLNYPKEGGCFFLISKSYFHHIKSKVYTFF